MCVIVTDVCVCVCLCHSSIPDVTSEDVVLSAVLAFSTGTYVYLKFSLSVASLWTLYNSLDKI